MGADELNTRVCKGEADERFGGFGGVTFALMLGIYSVGNFYSAGFVGRSFESTPAYVGSTSTMNQIETMNPRIGRTGTFQAGEPEGRDLGLLVRLKLREGSIDVVARLENEPQILCFDVQARLVTISAIEISAADVVEALDDGGWVTPVIVIDLDVSIAADGDGDGFGEADS